MNESPFLHLLPEQTRLLWEELRSEPLLGNAVLIGGTALTLRIGHRQSEDLDFSFQSLKLPRGRVDALLKKYPDWQRNDDQSAYEEFLIGGSSLHEYQQDFITENGVKVTFFAEEKNVWPLIKQENYLIPRVATLEEIFALKSLVSAKRSASRDWFDLYMLMKDHGFTVEDMERAFIVSKQESSLDISLMRLSKGILPPADKGYEALCENPSTLTEMKRFFSEKRDQYEINKAAATLKRSE